MSEKLNEEEGGTPANVTGNIAGKENTGTPPSATRRKELEDAITRAKESAHRMVAPKAKQ